jgi:dipeptidyl-peptidase-4
VREDTDPMWVTLVPGLPAHTDSGSLLGTADLGDTRHLTIDGEPVTPAGMEVREVLDVDGDTALFLASTDPADIQLWSWNPTGLQQLSDRPGLHDGARSGGTTVVLGLHLDQASARVTVHSDGHAPHELTSHAETPSVRPRVEFLRTGEHEMCTAVLYPTGHTPGDGPLPVLLDPYGGPAAQRVLYAQGAYLVSQWFADQGFIVVVADGRGTPGRGPIWERSVYGFSTLARVDDQAEALRATAERHADMDLSRVAIRGWSAGGTLAAAAVLRRPDVFHAAVAGAPVTDIHLYSSHWEEQFYGQPEEHPDVYDRNSLIADAPGLRRPLMLIHGLLDDNVHPAHTMRLSAALLAAGRPHTVLPLPGASHMTSAVDTTANLLVLQARFLLDALNPVRDLDAFTVN